MGSFKNYAILKLGWQKMSGENGLKKSSSDQLLGRTAMRKTTYLSPKVPKMEEEVSLSLDYEFFFNF